MFYLSKLPFQDQKLNQNFMDFIDSEFLIQDTRHLYEEELLSTLNRIVPLRKRGKFNIIEKEDQEGQNPHQGLPVAYS